MTMSARSGRCSSSLSRSTHRGLASFPAAFCGSALPTLLQAPLERLEHINDRSKLRLLDGGHFLAFLLLLDQALDVLPVPVLVLVRFER